MILLFRPLELKNSLAALNASRFSLKITLIPQVDLWNHFRISNPCHQSSITLSHSAFLAQLRCKSGISLSLFDQLHRWNHLLSKSLNIGNDVVRLLIVPDKFDMQESVYWHVHHAQKSRLHLWKAGLRRIEAEKE